MALVVAQLGCTEESGASPDASSDAAPADAASRDASSSADAPDAAYSCTPPSDCPDITVGGISTTACCSPVTECGYELPEPDAETLMYFPDVVPFVAELTEGDPNGRCAPESFFFSPQPGLWKHRVDVEDGEDILITPDCESFTVFAFILPGGCLPDDTCGLSTHESAATLGFLAEGMDVPFARPECVSAEVLNQQFRDSVVLEGLARTTASGTCDHAALAAELAE
jgi:hypothetical protein